MGFQVLTNLKLKALKRAIVAQFDLIGKLNKKIPQEILASLTGIDDAK
jgi:ATP-dependent Lon protease